MGRQAQLRLHQVMQRLLQLVLQVEVHPVKDLPAVVHLVVVLQVEAHPVADLQVGARLVVNLQALEHLVVADLQVEAHLVAVFQAVLQEAESRVVLQVGR